MTGKKATPPDLDKFTEVFSKTGQVEDIVDRETIALLDRFADNPDVEKARSEFERAEKLEDAFYKDFDGKHFAIR